MIDMKHIGKLLLFWNLGIVVYIFTLHTSLDLILSYALVKIEKKLPQKITWQKATTKIIPYPSLNIHKVRFKKSGVFLLEAKRISLFLNFCSIFSNRFIGITISSGYFQINQKKGAKDKSPTLRYPLVPIGLIKITNFRATICALNKTLKFTDLDIIATLDRDIKIKAKGKSDLATEFTLELKKSPNTLSFLANFDGLSCKKFLKFFPQYNKLLKEEISGRINGEISAHIEKGKIFSDFHLWAPEISAFSKVKKIDLSGNVLIDNTNKVTSFYTRATNTSPQWMVKRPWRKCATNNPTWPCWMSTCRTKTASWS